LQQRNGTRLTAPPAALSSATLSINPNWNASSPAPVEVPVKVDAAYGSFHANVSVPKAAQAVRYEVTLKLPGQDGSAANDAFQVADPRPPTAVVNLTTPDWVRQGGFGGAPTGRVYGGVFTGEGPRCRARSGTWARIIG
jgi:hypothetical protein